MECPGEFERTPTAGGYDGNPECHPAVGGGRRKAKSSNSVGMERARPPPCLDELLHVSRPPQMLYSPDLAGKITRAVLKSGGGKDLLEVDFATASVWYRGKKLRGASLPLLPGDAHWLRLD